MRAYFVWSPDARRAGAHAPGGRPPAIVPGPAGTRTRRSGARDLVRAHSQAGDRAPHGGRQRLHAAQAPAIVKAIQLYHVKGNGWNDIGYNFLVDRFGTVYEGRYGGIERNVVGAHAEGFNTGSFGVSLLGEYSSLRSRRGASGALEADRMAPRHRTRRPASTFSFISNGNARFPAACPSFCARSRVTATRASPTARARRCTASSPASREGGRDRPAEALRADGHRRRPRRHPRPGAAVVAGCPGRLTSPTPPGRSSPPATATAARSTGRWDAKLRRPATTCTRFAPTRPSRLRSGRSPARSATLRSRSPASPPIRRPSRRTATSRGRDDDRLHAEERRERDGEGARRSSEPRSCRCGKSLEARGRACVACRPGSLPDGIFQIELSASATGGRQATGRPSSSSRGRSAASPPRGSRSLPTPMAGPTGSPSASSSPARPRSGCGSSGTESGSRRRSRARSSGPARSSGTASNVTAGC